ncbi:LLM class F420-dependent oxidoreductase [Nocardiopsis sp. TSRI0078]|uniref:TIGR03620 family F420-dependent LLM class oxidoreductase n=1 Tax=unclassified Nocardiopsis TaxID=2649073 RepID=UPI00093B813D|nr:TIGR03620 family F420-dependent LLM class oxidoreductase [Nocardiopsis sp. TSRI0078]OKI12263.1 LLM class F420-dependent oxidoreductase [Nocardiopsis sp. TSRI0078]
MSPNATAVDLGTFGVWVKRTDLTADVAAGIERLGYGAIWVGGSPGADLPEVSAALDATSRVAVATGIVNIWSADAEAVAASFRRIESEHPGRFLLGIGAGHREANGPEAARPFHAVVDYLDTLDGGGVPADRRVVAALGPRMLGLSAERAAGTHPYLVNPEFTRTARKALGEGPLLAPEHKAALGGDRESTRRTAREGLSVYVDNRLTNYLANFRRLGFSDADFAGGGSDALVDAMVAQGEPETAAAELRAHLEAGADHVAVQPLAADGDLLSVLARLAPALGLPARG